MKTMSVKKRREENEKKHKEEIKLCKESNAVVAVGPRLQREYSKCLPNTKVHIITPGIYFHSHYIIFISASPVLICVSRHIISLVQIVTLVTFTHCRPLKKQGLENCTTILTFKHHQLNSQEWLDLTRIHTLKHCIYRLQKVQLKL